MRQWLASCIVKFVIAFSIRGFVENRQGRQKTQFTLDFDKKKMNTIQRPKSNVNDASKRKTDHTFD